jgi:hypothetical protein
MHNVNKLKLSPCKQSYVKGNLAIPPQTQKTETNVFKVHQIINQLNEEKSPITKLNSGRSILDTINLPDSLASTLNEI